MTSPRAGHTATLLYDGKVLIVGGQSGIHPANVLTTDELYDPSSGSFTAIANTISPHAGHTATLLPDGTVLIAGGTDNYAALASAEIYDPATRTFTAAGSMTTPRVFPTATLLSSWKVLIAGGINGRTLASAELYDPSTRTFTPTGDMTMSRVSHTATMLPNGKVFIAPGDDGDDWQSAEVYDPNTGTFSTAEWGAKNLTAATANLLPNGNILFTLQPPEGDFASDAAALYSSSAGTFTPTAPLLYARYLATGVTLSDGSVLVTGNYLGDCTGASSAEIYDATAGTLSSAGSMITGRNRHPATLLNDGSVLITGGLTPGRCQPAALLASAELYHPVAVAAAPVLIPGAILHAGTHRMVSAGDPAAAGEALEIYGTGLIDDGVIPPQVAVGGRLAEVLYFGKAPGFAGLNQINIRVPAGVAPWPVVPVRLTYLGRHSNEVTIGIH